MAYLVTGGAGFVGSHVAEKLLSQGKQVVVIDNFNDYYDPVLKRKNIERITHANMTLVEGDIRDFDLVKRMFADYEITHVAHMAALGGVRASVTQVETYMHVNLIGTMHLLEAANAHHIQQFVFASTSSVYGNTEVLPFIETDNADRPLASYPASKRAAELLGHTYNNLHGMNFTALRFFNVYGPAGRPDMMPLRLMNATQDGSEIPIFNNGEIHRDWTYIDDIVNGVVSALETPLGYEIMNLGCGAPISLKDFVEIIEEYSGVTINKKAVPTPLSDPPITYCNNQKIRDLLGFAPVTDIRTGLKRTWDWFINSRT